MSNSSELPTNARQQIVDAALFAIHKAKRDDDVLSLSSECRRLADRHPDRVAAPEDIRELVATLAVKRHVNIAFD